MKLAELEPEFLKRIDDRQYRRDASISMEDADGIRFLCPVCFKANNGPRGTHSVICWRPRVPAEVSPGPGRWEFAGTGLGDLSLVAGSSSVQLLGGCRAHFFVKNGAIECC